ncbi:hypothetical protein B194_2045 [Serratia plymuthica A30]|nr:hypothetical protein B194_2045 [Serratia plymuthica A30]
MIRAKAGDHNPPQMIAPRVNRRTGITANPLFLTPYHPCSVSY